ncbi:MAG: FeoB-associated Cys-rich membrane protein [Pyrinomonadaceae bacterium]|nr:FeoB-associated Cys-rich membrane protein [Pyrinomonadaceae bacterium]
MIDWQTIAVMLIVFGAAAYVALRAYNRLRSFLSTKSGSSCASGCGGCSEHRIQSPQAPKVLLQIDRSSAVPRRSAR